jgi:hypothetical protein
VGLFALLKRETLGCNRFLAENAKMVVLIGTAWGADSNEHESRIC